MNPLLLGKPEFGAMGSQEAQTTAEQSGQYTVKMPPIQVDTQQMIRPPAPPYGNVETYFQISHTNEKNEKVTFVFELLPAIEDKVSAQGNRVPEVRPGILLDNRMRRPKIIIPGAAPVIQTVGIEGRRMFIVGLFLGTEKFTNLKSKSQTQIQQGGGYSVADQFLREMVFSGLPVVIDIQSNSSFDIVDGKQVSQVMSIKAQGLIMNQRNQVVRFDRVYYALDIELTDYVEESTPEKKPAPPAAQPAPKPATSTPRPS